MHRSELRVGADQAGQRLDRALQVLCPESSLRTRRRLIEAGQVLVNGEIAHCARKLRLKDVIGLCLRKDTSPASARFLKQHGGLFFFFKPRGLHTVRLAGSPSPSLEALLPELWDGEEKIRLVQRLDCGTSGIVTGVCSDEALSVFRDAEESGHVLKKYFALLEGSLAATCMASQALDTKKRARTKLLSAEAPRSRRTTLVPLAHLASGSPVPPWLRLPLPVLPCHLTLAGCSIQRGARHQIRAHAAGLGYPLFGDSLYGGSTYAWYFLHQAVVSLPGVECHVLPDWLSEEALPLAFWDWLAWK
ncbi:MAG: pseudouridine synthase [Desulfovibrio sp.]|nr:pseudouridine synthase [Desulfovibrio sp.]